MAAAKKISTGAAIAVDLSELILTFKEEPKMVPRTLLGGQHWTGFGKISVAVHSGLPLAEVV